MHRLRRRAEGSLSARNPAFTGCSERLPPVMCRGAVNPLSPGWTKPEISGSSAGCTDSTSSLGYLNDLWKFSPTSDQWTWMGGSNSIGPTGSTLPGVYGQWMTPAATSYPGGRSGAVSSLCAEAVGVMQALLDATVTYVQNRQQFGVPIGRFQALQHRIADMLIHLEQARSMSYLAALRCADENVNERRRALSAAKAVIGQACRFVGQQAVQLHGGMGMTDELIVSHWFKRLTAAELMFGDSDAHLQRYAALTR